MYDYSDYYDYYDYSSTPAFNPLPTIISLVLCVFVLVCMWIIFRKAGKPGWAAIVPFYNLYVLFDITWGSGMRFLLMLIPLYNIILGIQTQIRLAKAFGKGGGFAAGLIFLPYVFMPLLAFGKGTYQGVPIKAAPYQNNPYQNAPIRVIPIRVIPISRAAIPSSLISPIRIPIPSSPSSPSTTHLSRAISSRSSPSTMLHPSRGISSPNSPSMPPPPSSRSMLRRSSHSSIQRPSSHSSLRHPSSHSSLPLSSLSPSSRRRRPALPLFAPAAERRATVRNSARTAVPLCADPSCHSWTE